MDTARRVTRLGTAIGIVVAAAGLVTLLAHLVVSMLTGPGTSFEDAYWTGRLPWIPIAFWLMLGGLTLAAVFGGVTVMLRGPAIARLAALVPAAPIAFWWFWASLPPPGGRPCDPGECVPRVADPVALAYTLPETMFLYFVVPAILLVILAALAVRRDRRI